MFAFCVSWNWTNVEWWRLIEWMCIWRLTSTTFVSFLLLSFWLMSLRLTGFHPCREYWFANVFWSCSVFFLFFFYTLVVNFFWAIRPICCTGSNPWLQRRGECLEGTHPLHSPLYSPAQANECAAWGRWMQRLFTCVYVWVCACVYACEEDGANQSSSRYLPPPSCLVWYAPSPPSVVSAAV